MIDDQKSIVQAALWIAALALMLLLPSTGQCSEITAFGETFQSSYQKPGFDLWHQEGVFPVDWHTRPSGFRLGGEWEYLRLFYGDAGKYHFTGEASDNEECVVATKSRSCPGDTDVYTTAGSMRFVGVTANGCYGVLCGELGPAYVRQNFHESKDDGFDYQATKYGLGYFGGLRVTMGKQWNVGAYRLTAKITFEYPSGTGHVDMIALGYKF